MERVGGVGDCYISHISDFEKVFAGKETHLYTTADAIIAALAYRETLTAKQVYSEIRRLPIKPISYRATHKMLNHLRERCIVDKNGKLYCLNMDWIRRIRNLAQSMESKIPTNLLALCDLNNGVAMIKVGSIMQLHQILLGTYQIEAEKPKYAEVRFLSWVLLHPDCIINEERYRTSKNKWFTVSRSNTPIDRWSRDIELAFGLNVATGGDCARYGDLYAIGDYVVEYSYPKEEACLVDRIYTSIKNLSYDSRKKAHALLKEVCLRESPIQITVTKNPRRAEQVRENILHNF